MKRVARTLVIAVISFLVVAISVAVVSLVKADHKFDRVVAVKVQPVPYATGEAAIQRGQYLFDTRGCAECHGADANGKVFMNDHRGMYIKTPNLTRGNNGVASRYTEVDWVRTIRQGIKPDGHPLRIMPAEIYNRLTDADLAAIVAYVRSLPPGKGTGAEIHLPLVYKVLYAWNKIKDAEQLIDHTLPPSTPVPLGPTAAYGAYVANMCSGCHRQDFSGGKIQNGPPDWPPAANLTSGPGGIMSRYPNVASFKAMLQSGKRPDGSAVNEAMPFPSLAGLSDNDVEALYAFFKTLPAHATGQ